MSMAAIFFLFFKIGILTFGGGYAMIPLFFTELVSKLNLINSIEFGNVVALAQMTPGPVGLNFATYTGYLHGGGIGGGFSWNNWDYFTIINFGTDIVPLFKSGKK